MTGTLPCTAVARWPARRDMFGLVLFGMGRGAKVWSGGATAALGQALQGWTWKNTKTWKHLLHTSWLEIWSQTCLTTGSKWRDAGSMRQMPACVCWVQAGVHSDPHYPGVCSWHSVIKKWSCLLACVHPAWMWGKFWWMNRFRQPWTYAAEVCWFSLQ